MKLASRDMNGRATMHTTNMEYTAASLLSHDKRDDEATPDISRRNKSLTFSFKNEGSRGNVRIVGHPERLVPAYSTLQLLFAATIGMLVGLQLAPQGYTSSSLVFRGLPECIDLNRAPTGPTPHIIEAAKNRAIEFDSLVDPTLSMLAKGHPSFRDMNETHKPEPQWTKNHFADVNIFGLPKSGTSQLYFVLTSHPKMRAFHSQPEFCFNIGDHAVNAAIQHLKPPGIVDQRGLPLEMRTANFVNESPDVSSLPQMDDWKFLNHNETEGNLTVNKCLSPHKFFLQRQYLQAQGKVIVLLRDPADLLWASWNYWSRPSDMVRGDQNGWTSSTNQYRSPELFHELLLSVDRFGPAHELLTFVRTINMGPLRVLAETVDPSDVLVLKTEDLNPENVETSGLVDTLAKFLGVPKEGFNTSILHSYTNCGDDKGIKLCSGGKGGTSAYEITGNRPMLEKSRELVYLHFAEECKMWKEKFGVSYDGCLTVRDRYVESR